MQQDIYIYDGDCAMCSRFVRFLVARERTGRLRIAAAQSACGRKVYLEEGLCPDAMETAILRLDGRTYVNLDVFIEGLALCGGLYRLAGVLRILPRPVADWLYRRIARNRKLFNRGVCPIPTPEMKARQID